MVQARAGLLCLDPSPRGESQGSAKWGGKEGRHQPWPSFSECEQHYEGDIHSQWLSTAVFVGNMRLFPSQGGLVHQPPWLLPTGKLWTGETTWWQMGWKDQILSAFQSLHVASMVSDRDSQPWEQQMTKYWCRQDKTKTRVTYEHTQQHLYDGITNWMFVKNHDKYRKLTENYPSPIFIPQKTV